MMLTKMEVKNVHDIRCLWCWCWLVTLRFEGGSGMLVLALSAWFHFRCTALLIICTWNTATTRGQRREADVSEGYVDGGDFFGGCWVKTETKLFCARWHSCAIHIDNTWLWLSHVWFSVCWIPMVAPVQWRVGGEAPPIFSQGRKVCTAWYAEVRGTCIPLARAATEKHVALWSWCRLSNARMKII